jgi:zinc transporter, ZIP family
MEARATSTRPQLSSRVPGWLLGLAPLVLIGAAVWTFAALGAPGLGDRTGPPVEDLAVERTVLHPGTIELAVRNQGPDAVEIAQVSINDGYAPFTVTDGHRVDRLGATTIEISYPWIEGEAYGVTLLTSTGATIEHEIAAAAETPTTDLGFFGLMALLGVYVGVIPVSLGMLWLPFARRVRRDWLRILIAFTVGLLGLLGIDAALEGIEIAQGATAFGGVELVILGAAVSYLVLAGIDSWLSRRREAAAQRVGPAAIGPYLALMVAIGIGMHNLGEGLAIGSAYATGALALGTFLVVGFAIHNTTEGLAIVSPLTERPPGIQRLFALGLIAGAPAILGAGMGAAAFDPNLAALLFGAGVGAIGQVIWQLVPAMRDDEGRTLHPGSVAGMLSGMALLYLTGLLVSV